MTLGAEPDSAQGAAMDGREVKADAVGSPGSGPVASLVANFTLAAWLAADMVRIGLFAKESFDIGWQAWAEIGILGIVAAMVLLRPRPRRVDASSGTLAVAIAASVLPLLYGETGTIAQPSQAILIVQACALALMGWATLTLGTNFSVLPHYRSLVTAGPYKLVRHPLYLSYLVLDGALAIGLANAAATGLWLVEFMLLADRARREDRLLAASDAGYCQYSVDVPYRFIPFLL
jgi:protein-S-isoprenylcysteine O-methyltransferase Ste14